MTDQPKRTAPATDAKAARTTFLRESVRRLQTEGGTEDDIAVILGISRFAVRAFDREINPPKIRQPVEKAPSRSNDNDWPASDIGRLQELWAEGHSANEIGRKMGRSKNAVVGKAHRLNLPARESPITRRDPTAPTAVVRRVKPPALASLMEERAMQPPQDVPQPTAPPSAQTVAKKPLEGAVGLAVARERAKAPPVEIPKQSLVDILRPTPVPLSSKMGCQFITNEKDGPEWTPIFCDTPRRDGSSYCSDHHKLCHTSYYGQRPPKAPGEADAVDAAEGIPG